MLAYRLLVASTKQAQTYRAPRRTSGVGSLPWKVENLKEQRRVDDEKNPEEIELFLVVPTRMSKT